MKKKEPLHKTIFQGLDKTLNGWSNGTFTTNVKTNNNPNTYNYGQDIILRTTDKAEYEKVKLQAKQDKFLANKWYMGSAQSNMSALNNMNLVDLMYRDVELMCTRPEINTAIEIMMEEACTIGGDGNLINIYSKSPRIKQVLDDLFINRLQIHITLPTVTRTMLKYGNSFQQLNINSNNGVIAWKELPVSEIKRLESQYPYGYVAQQITPQNADDLTPRFIWMGAGVQMDFRNWEISHFRLLNDSFFKPYGACLRGDTRIETECGFKEIQHIQKGDKVWSFDINTQEKVLNEVVDTVCSGEKEILNIRTQHNYIDASNEHMVMVYEAGKFLYKRADELQVDDLLVINNNHGGGVNIKIDKTPIPSSRNRGVKWFDDNIHLMPDYVDEKFARFMGFMVGDGSIAAGRRVSFATGVYESYNKEFADYMKEISNCNIKWIKQKKPKSSCEHLAVEGYSKFLVTMLYRMGYIDGFDKKRIPKWVFMAKPNVRKAFLGGLMIADGSLFIDNRSKNGVLRCDIELCNEQLVKDIKVLCQSLGYKTGHVFGRNRVGHYSEKVGKFFNFKNTSYQLSFYETLKKQQKKHDIKCGRLNNGFILDRIKKITKKKEDLVYDIQVGGDCHNFYANGIVVHNSILNGARRHWRLLSLMEDAMLLYRIEKAFERRVFYVDVGAIDQSDVQTFIQDIANNFKRGEIVDPITGQIDLRKNILAIDQDLFIPTRPGSTGTRIETLPSGSNLDKIEDLQYIHHQMLTALRIPKQYLGFNEEKGGRSLSQLDVRFSKVIVRIQQALIMELNKIAIIHLYLLGFEDDLNNFTITMNNPSTQGEILRIEELQKKILMMKDAVGDSGNGLPMMSYRYALKNIMKFSDEEIATMLEDIRLEKAISTELDFTTQIIQRTGVFDKVDRLYGADGAQYQGIENANTGDIEGAAIGGGGMIGGGLGEGDFETGDTGGDLEGETESTPIGEGLFNLDMSDKLLTEAKKNIQSVIKTKEKGYLDMYINKLKESKDVKMESEMTQSAGLITEGSFFNEEYHRLQNGLDKFIET